MASTSTRPTDVEVAAIAIDVQAKLRQAETLLREAHEQSERLELATENLKVPRFGSSLDNAASAIESYLGSEHAGSEFEISNAIKEIDEFLELLAYAVKEDR